MKVTVTPILVSALETVLKGLARIVDLRNNQDHLEHNALKINKNILKSP